MFDLGVSYLSTDHDLHSNLIFDYKLNGLILDRSEFKCPYLHFTPKDTVTCKFPITLSPAELCAV